jgi:hypothetical protein
MNSNTGTAMKKFGLAFVAAAVGLSSVVNATTLETVGKVSVNRAPVTGTVAVKAGDVIAVEQGSSALITYDNGRQEAVAAGDVGLVKDGKPLAGISYAGGGSLKDDNKAGGYVNPGSSAAAAGSAAGGIGIAEVAIGVAVVGLVGFGIYELRKPASP